MDNLKDQEVLGNNWASSGDEMNGWFAAQAPHCLLIMANQIKHFDSKFLNSQMSDNFSKLKRSQSSIKLPASSVAHQDEWISNKKFLNVQK